MIRKNLKEYETKVTDSDGNTYFETHLAVSRNKLKRRIHRYHRKHPEDGYRYSTKASDILYLGDEGEWL